MNAQNQHHGPSCPPGKLKLIGGPVETVGWLVFGLFLFGTATFIILFFVLPRTPQKWPVVPANVVDARVLKKIVGSGSPKPLIVYDADVQLRYSVNGRDYLLWTNAGVVDSDAEWVRQHIPQAGFTVRYDPEHPEHAEAYRK